MALRGKKPKVENKRCKLLMYGPPGVGKTTAAIQFPRPYLLDTERGAENEQYVELITKAEGATFQTVDFEEMVQECRALLTEEHPYRTLIIDPVTTVHQDLIEQAEVKVGTEFGRHYGEAKKRWKRLMNLVMRLDMNVVMTSHSKNLYGDGMKVVGETFDGPKGLDYTFDLILELRCDRKEQRKGIVRKSRVATLPLDQVIDPWAYSTFAELYGRDILERDAVPVELASTEQVQRIKALISDTDTEPEIVEKWLAKANASSFDEMPVDVIEKCIGYLEKRLEMA